MPKKNKQLYTCEKCNFSCVKKSNYEKHIITKKHKIEKNDTSYKCLCGKIYNYHSSLWKHKQKCVNMNSNNNENNNEKHMTTNIEAFKNEVIATLMTQLSGVLEEQNKSILAEQTKLMIESQNKIITEIANKPTNANTFNNNNNQTNNQQFNLNMFLNETCKDAMNLSEFLENMHVSMEDMEKTGELGFAKGMSRIIMNNLNAIDVCKRPIHCSDVKRETLYVKNNGVWEKETEDRKRTKEIIYKASRLNLKELLKWRDLPRNKGYDKSDHTKNDEFTNLVMEINKMREEEFDKIITSVSKHVAIDKEKVKMSGYLN